MRDHTVGVEAWTQVRAASGRSKTQAQQTVARGWGCRMQMMLPYALPGAHERRRSRSVYGKGDAKSGTWWNIVPALHLILHLGGPVGSKSDSYQLIKSGGCFHILPRQPS